MTDWEPATEVEAAMRDALRSGDQELYFRILARSELLLPVSSEALAGRAPVGWGTWTTNGRTHVLAFTSGDALRICLADNAGSARRMPYHDLAASWPNLEWWLAVNPGLPIEGYLPAWFVSQLARGDVRLPGRTMGARARLDRAESAARARARATVPGQVVQGEIVEPPFVDRAAAAVGPVLEPDSIEPPQRNRPSRPPGYDSPLASIRRRAGVAPADPTPSSPAAPPPYRPVPPPQVTDATPYRPVPPPQVTDAAAYRPVPPPQVTDAAPYRPVPPPQVTEATPYRPAPPPQVTDAAAHRPVPPPQVTDATPYLSPPTGNGHERQPAANGDASAWPPPVVQGRQPPRRQPVEPPREVSDQPTPPMRPRSPFRDDPARLSPPRFSAPPPVPQPPARPTSGGGFFGGSDADAEPPRRPAAPAWSGQPAARDDPRPTTWSPANASVPTETRPPAGTPNGSPTPSWPTPGRDPSVTPGWSDSTPPARPAQSWPAGAAPSQPWPASQAGPDIPATRAPQARPEQPAPLPVRKPGGPPSSGAGSATVPQLWPDHPVTGPTRASEGGPPRADDRPGDAPGQQPPGPAWSDHSPAGKPGRSQSTLARVWSNRGSAAAPEGSTAVPTREPHPAAPQLWADSKPPARPELPARAEPPQSGSAAAQPRPHTTSSPESAGAQRRPEGGPSSGVPAEPQTGPAAQPRPDGNSSADVAGRSESPSAAPDAAAQLWSDGNPSANVDREAASAIDLWSDSKPAADVDRQSAAATDLWSDSKPPADGDRPSASSAAAADVWSDSKPSDGGGASGATTANAGADSGAPAGTDQPPVASGAATDLWSQSTPPSDASGGAERSPAGGAEADLWANSGSSSGAPAGVDRQQTPTNAAADLWSDSGSSAGAEKRRLAENAPTDLWSDSGSSAGADQRQAASNVPADLWSGGGSSQDASAGADQTPAGGTAADGWRAGGSSPDAPAGAERGSAGGSAADLWSDSRPPSDGRADGSSSSADPWPGAASASEEPQATGTPQAGLWTDSSAPDAEQPSAAAGALADLWSGGQPAAGGKPAAGHAKSQAETHAAADLWAASAPSQTQAPAEAEQAAGAKPGGSDSPGTASDRPEAGVGQQRPDADVADGGRPSAGTAPEAEMWRDRSADQQTEPRSSATDLWPGRTTPAAGDTQAEPSFADLWLDRDGGGAAPSGPPEAAQPDAAQADAARLWRDRTPAAEPTERRGDPHAGWSGSTPVTPFAPTDGPSTSQAWATTPSWLDQAAPAQAQQPADTSLFTAEVPADFRPANDVEESLLTAAGDGSTDTFLSTLLLARVLLPVSSDSTAGAKPGGDGFVWRTEMIDDQPYVVVFTSPERMAEHLDASQETVTVKFVRLINSWPQEDWSFAVNPGTPVGAKLPGAQIVALASWAAEVGLDAGDDEPPVAAAPKQEAPKPAPAPATVDAAGPTMMQKTIAPSQVDYYLERGYDRVSGFVHRVAEVAHLSSPAQLFTALGLGYANSPFAAAADEVYVLRWPAYRPSLYRIPYGGPNETAMRAMEGWVIERAPFRGNGFAPGEGSEVIAEFKVDSARLPHGAQLWLIRADGSEKLVAVLDADAPGWTRVGDQ